MLEEPKDQEEPEKPFSFWWWLDKLALVLGYVIAGVFLLVVLPLYAAALLLPCFVLAIFGVALKK